MISPISFHLAIPVHDLTITKSFYTDILGFELGRETKHAAIINFAGHQVVLHRTRQKTARPVSIYPFHFGLNLTRHDWEALLLAARTNNAKFFHEPKTRFPDKVTEHDSFFLLDPSNNLLEFKCYTNTSAIFGEQQTTEIGEN